MKKTIALIVPLVLALALAAPAAGHKARKKNKAAGGGTADAKLARLAVEWKNAYNGKDARKLEPLYAENAEYISAHVDGYHARGRAAVIANFQRGIDGGGSITALDVLSTVHTREMASMVTRYVAVNSGRRVEGRNLLVLKKGDAGWRIVTHMTVVKE